MITNTKESKGGRPPHFGLRPKKPEKEKTNDKAVLNRTTEMVPVKSKEVASHSNAMVEFRHNLYSKKNTIKNGKIRQYYRRECHHCKLQYVVKEQQWLASLSHIVACCK